MRRLAGGVAIGAVAALLLAACLPLPARGGPIALAATYPLSGSQGEGGRDELRGVELAVRFVNHDGGIHGRPVQLTAVDAPNADEAATAVRQAVHRSGARVVLGSYGSTIALPAADAAGALGVTFWETGATTDVLTTPGHPYRFRTVGSGSSLGRTAVRFAADVVAARLGRPAATLRVAIAYADDVYGRSVALGHRAEAATVGMPLVFDTGYPPRTFNPSALAGAIQRAQPDILLASSYLEDGVALRRALLEQGIQLGAIIGTSSGFCLADFGKALGSEAVGLFAADKPDGQIRSEALTGAARALLDRARAAYQDLHGTNMSAAALQGFVGAWVLLHEVLPRARTLEPAAVAEAALAVDLPMGALINGSGVRFAPPQAPDAGQNRRAIAVVGQWQAPELMRVVYPQAFAQERAQFIPLRR